MFLRLLLLLLAAMLAYHFTHLGSKSAVQPAAAISLSPGPAGFGMVKNGYRIVPLETFSIEAKVLSSMRYRFDRESSLAPVDLALGWGPMANPAVSEKLSVSQGERWFYWRASEFPIPRREIETHSANMHMIPATPAIDEMLKSIQKGDTVRVSGYLVEAQGADGWRWRSSLSREDTGAGACELVWVETLDVQ
ncbi:MAG: hypothetical protein ABW205_07070 [Burkholderiales bacterium]